MRTCGLTTQRLFSCTGLPDAQPWTLVHFKDGVRGVVVDLHRGDRVSVALIDYHRMGRGAHAVCTNERLETITGRAVRGTSAPPGSKQWPRACSLGVMCVLHGMQAVCLTRWEHPSMTWATWSSRSRCDAHPRQLMHTPGMWLSPHALWGPCAHLPQKLVRATLKHDLPPVLSRAPAERFLPSGLKAVDAFFPIARGSNVAVVGGRYVHGTLRFRGVCPIPHRCVWLCVNASGAWARVRWRWTCSSPSTA